MERGNRASCTGVEVENGDNGVWRRRFDLPCVSVIAAGLLCWASSIPVVAAQEPSPLKEFPAETLQGILDGVVAKGIPGASLGVGNDGASWFGASGVANVKTGAVMTPDHQLRIASVTKALASLVIWKQIEIESQSAKPKLTLDNVVDDFLKPGLVDKGEAMTVGMLLNHTSGIYDHEEDPGFMKISIEKPTKQWSSRQVLKISREHGSVTPGTEFAYCNTGYYVLGMIAQKVGKKNPDKLFAKYVAEPSGVSKTSLNVKGAFTSKTYTPGYCYMDGKKEMLDIGKWNFSWDWTAGSAVTTPRDMVAIASALMAAKIVNAETMDTMWTVQAPSGDFYGFEPLPEEFQKQFSARLVCKAGCNAGTTTLWIMCPEQKWSVFMGFNFSDYRSDVTINLDTNHMIFNACMDVAAAMGWK